VSELFTVTKSPEERIALLEAEVAAIKANGKPRGHGSMRPEDWTVKENHAEIRSRVYTILDKVVAMSYEDVVTDSWLPVETHLNSSIQWLREVRYFLVKDKTRHYPPREIGQEPLREFLVAGRGRPTSYLAKGSTLHCAVEKAVRAEKVGKARAAQVVRRLREELDASDEAKCSVCGPVIRGERSTP
jgi:hypothetical protein